MKKNVKTLEPCKKEINIEVSPVAVKEEFDKVFTEISKHSNIKGFRPGKAPRNIVETHYAEFAKKEVIESLMPKYYQQAITEEKISAAGYPEISAVELKDGKLSFKAVLETRPQIDLKNYKGIKIKPVKFEVAEKDINDALENMRKAFAQSQGVKEEDKDKKADLPVLDDEFAKKAGYKGLEEFKAKVRESLEFSAKEKAHQGEVNQIVDFLLAGQDFEVPKSWQERQHSGLVNSLKRNLIMSGVKPEELDKKMKEKEAQIIRQAQNNVRLFFILEEIADKEKIKVSEEELAGHIQELAAQQHISPDRLKEYLDKNNLWDDLIVEMGHGKIMDYLFKESVKA